MHDDAVDFKYEILGAFKIAVNQANCLIFSRLNTIYNSNSTSC